MFIYRNCLLLRFLQTRRFVLYFQFTSKTVQTLGARWTMTCSDEHQSSNRWQGGCSLYKKRNIRSNGEQLDFADPNIWLTAGLDDWCLDLQKTNAFRSYCRIEQQQEALLYGGHRCKLFAISHHQSNSNHTDGKGTSTVLCNLLIKHRHAPMLAKFRAQCWWSIGKVSRQKM